MNFRAYILHFKPYILHYCPNVKDFLRKGKNTGFVKSNSGGNCCGLRVFNSLLSENFEEAFVFISAVTLLPERFQYCESYSSKYTFRDILTKTTQHFRDSFVYLLHFKI